MAILLFSIVCPLAAHIVQKLPQLVDLALLERLLGVERGDKAAERPAVEPL